MNGDDKMENEKEVEISSVIPVQPLKKAKTYDNPHKVAEEQHKKKWEWNSNKYNTNVMPNFNNIITWVSEGMTESEIAKRLDVSVETWCRYKREKPELIETIQIGERLLCSKIESSLVNLCTGFHYKTAKTTTWFDDDGNKHQKIEEIDNYLPPNNASIQFLLKNRAPDRWKNDTQELLITNKNESDRKQLFMDMLKDDAKDADVVDTEPKQIDNGNV